MNGLEKVKHLFQTSNRASFVTTSLSRTKKGARKFSKPQFTGFQNFIKPSFIGEQTTTF